MTFFGAQEGLWGARRGSDFLIFRKKGVIYLKKINLSTGGDRWQQMTKSGECVGGKFALSTHCQSLRYDWLRLDGNFLKL